MILTTQSLTKFGLTALSAFILTACGSGGSNSGTNYHATPQQTSNKSSKILQPKHSVQPNNAQLNSHTDSITPPTQPNTEKHMQPNLHTDSIAPATQPNTEKHMQLTPHTNSIAPATQPNTEKHMQPNPHTDSIAPATQPNTEKHMQPNPHTDSIALATQPNTEKHIQPNPHTDSIAPATQPNTEKHMQPTPHNHTGGYTVINRRDKEKIHPLTNIDINKINIDDENIDIMPNEDINSPWTIYSQSNRDIIICCEKYSFTRFGIIDSPNESIPTYIFYNGKPTQSMPLGKASYSGKVIGGIGEYNKKTGYDSGISNFDVDFGEKKLEGTLTIKNIKPVHVDANIQNNTFTGTATSDAFKSDTKVEVQGKFFGENAKELGGIAESHDDSFSAAFGAQKQ